MRHFQKKEPRPTEGWLSVGEVDRQWKESNPQFSRSHAATLSARLQPIGEDGRVTSGNELSDVIRRESLGRATTFMFGTADSRGTQEI